MKKFLALLLSVLVIVSACFALVSCDVNGPDGPSEGTPADSTDAPVPQFTVAENGASDYKFVIGNVAEYVADNVELVSERLTKSGINILVAGEGETPAHRITVETSEDYNDPEGGVLSFEGYRILAGGANDLKIVGGNIESTCAALEYFENLFVNGSLKLDENYEYNFHPFKKLDGFSVCGVPIGEFSVETIAGDSLAETAAKYIKKILFTHAGAYVEDNKDAAHKIILKYGSYDTTEGSVAAEEGNLIVTGSKKIGFYRVFRDFLDYLAAAQPVETDIQTDFGLDVIGLSGDAKKEFKVDYGDFITYEDYGAAGDGTTDDAKAIFDAHSAQKDSGRVILAREDAVYYIGKSAKIAKITADVDWSAAHFIVDDSELKSTGGNIFSVPAAGKSVSLKNDLKKVSEGQESLGVTLTAKSLVTLVNDGVKEYIRKGANQDSGSSRKEIIIVDENGSVDPSTPVIREFKKLTSATAIPVNDEVLTVRGGIFTTIANQAASNYSYYNRGIEIQRSNAVIKELAHYITGEGETGAPYNGFLMVSNTYNLTVKDTVLTPHFTYYTMGTGGSVTPMGSYDCQVTNSVGLNFINVIQSRSINDVMYWGTFASNYSRNICFDGCVIGRFDAHKGVCNVTLKNSSFGHQGINLIGHGEALIENCNIYGKNIINLRDDYGSTWEGNITIKNCRYYPLFGTANYDAALIGGTNTFDHDFGYTCYLPKNIVIDGLYVNDSRSLSGDSPTVFADINPQWNKEDYKGKYPMVMTESVKVKNFVSYSGKPLEPSPNMYMFEDLKIDLE